jgi:hypothetical protein
MFEKITQAAEKAASSIGVSRRGFLGRLGRAALGGAVTLGGVLLLPDDAKAGRGHVCVCCYLSDGSVACVKTQSQCPAGTYYWARGCGACSIFVC